VDKELVKCGDYTIAIDRSRDALFDEMGLRRLRDSYLQPDEDSPQIRFARVSAALASNEAHAQRLYDYSSQHWLSYSTPILSYVPGGRGLPISCYLTYIHDSAEGLVDALSEVCYLSMAGGGVGLGIGIRSEDGKSVGVMPHLKTYENVSLAYRQGTTRRGSFAGYLGIGHPNIKQFIDMRKPTGDASQRCLELHHGVNVPDAFMEIIKACMVDADADDSWPLVDPHSGVVKEVVSARELWEAILDSRIRTGEPYIHFIDASNEAMPEYQKALGLSVTQSNICTEITLPTDRDRTAVCCLSSPNLEYWDQWRGNYLFVRDIAEMLDNALDLFIRDAPDAVSRAKFSAMRERAIGVGALGFHALLQSKGIPFEGALATSLNHQIFSQLRTYLDRASRELAEERGPCPDAATVGLMERFSCKMAIAPNASTSILMGNTSASIELYRANAYRQDTLSGSHLHKNKYLDRLLRDRLQGEEYDDAWHGVVKAAGSCQHLTCLTDYEKLVFKTATEVDQLWVVEHAYERQQYIDQAQSLNLFFTADASIDYMHHVHFTAWQKRLKTLYYCRSDKIYHGEGTTRHRAAPVEFKRSVDESTCLACEG